MNDRKTLHSRDNYHVWLDPQGKAGRHGQGYMLVSAECSADDLDEVEDVGDVRPAKLTATQWCDISIRLLTDYRDAVKMACLSSAKPAPSGLAVEGQTGGRRGKLSASLHIDRGDWRGRELLRFDCSRPLTLPEIVVAFRAMVNTLSRMSQTEDEA